MRFTPRMGSRDFLQTGADVAILTAVSVALPGGRAGGRGLFRERFLSTHRETIGGQDKGDLVDDQTESTGGEVLKAGETFFKVFTGVHRQFTGSARCHQPLAEERGKHAPR